MCLRSVSLLNCGALSACYGAYADVTPVSGFYLEATSKQSGKYLTVAIYSTASIAVKGVKCGDTESCFGANILFEGNMEIEKIECDGERACQDATFYFNAGAYVDVEFKCAKTSSCLGCTVIVDGGVPISCGASVARAVSAGDEIDSEQPGVQMTTAEIAGISIVSVLAVLLIVTVAVCCFVRRIRKMERRVIEQEKQYLDVHVAKQTAAKEGGSLVGRNEAEASGVEMTSATFHD